MYMTCEAISESSISDAKTALAEAGLDSPSQRLGDKGKSIVGRVARENPSLQSAIRHIYNMSIEELEGYMAGRTSINLVKASRKILRQ